MLQRSKIDSVWVRDLHSVRQSKASPQGKTGSEAWELAKLVLSDVDKYLAEGTLSQDLL
jgi:hypothetical protein